MTPAELARLDQAQAREHNIEAQAHRYVRVLLIVAAIVGLYAVLAVLGFVPAMPWSALGKS